jgi:hypothetical protein
MLCVVEVHGGILTSIPEAILATDNGVSPPLKFRDLRYWLVFDIFRARWMGHNGSPLPESSLTDLELECGDSTDLLIPLKRGINERDLGKINH